MTTPASWQAPPFSPDTSEGNFCEPPSIQAQIHSYRQPELLREHQSSVLLTTESVLQPVIQALSADVPVNASLASWLVQTRQVSSSTALTSSWLRSVLGVDQTRLGSLFNGALQYADPTLQCTKNQALFSSD